MKTLAVRNFFFTNILHVFLFMDDVYYVIHEYRGQMPVLSGAHSLDSY